MTGLVLGTSYRYTTQANQLHAIPPHSRPLLFGKRDVYGSTFTEEPFAVIQTVRYPSLHGPLSSKRPLSYFCLRALNSITVTYSRRSLCIFHPLPKSYYSKAETIEFRALCDSMPPNSGTKLWAFKTTGFKISTPFKRMRKSWAECQDRQKSQQFIVYQSLSYKDLPFFWSFRERIVDIVQLQKK